MIRADSLDHQVLKLKYGAYLSTGRLSKFRHINVKLRFKISESYKPIRPRERQEECKAVDMGVVAPVAMEAVLLAVKLEEEAVHGWAVWVNEFDRGHKEVILMEVDDVEDLADLPISSNSERL